MAEVLFGLFLPGEVLPGYAHRITEQEYRWEKGDVSALVCALKFITSPDSRFLDQDVEVPIMLQVPCGHLGVRAASPEDIRPSGPFDRPA